VQRRLRLPRGQSAKQSSGGYDCFAAAAPGLEGLALAELNALGMSAHVEDGGAAFQGDIEALARANLWLRTASRVIVRVASFRAQAFHELERLARAIAWERFIAAGAPIRFRVTSRKSRLYHTGAIEQRLAEAIEHRLGKLSDVSEVAADEEVDSQHADAQLFVVRVVHDVFTVSVDSSGALLHQRGYRRALAKAPMRETLAAAMLVVSGWDGRAPLIDPMCGSGTIPIEAALIARRIPPGLERTFAFVRWPEVDEPRWTRIRDEARSLALPRVSTLIRGSDRDAGAIEAARANAERAGVSADIGLEVQPLSSMQCTAMEGGSVVTNPPYGVRVGEAAALRDLYARLGQIIRSCCPDWRLVILSANGRLEAQLRLSLSELVRTKNGGIPVRILLGEVGG
jgi:putative N6-adenine-specific DNA methylase